MKNLDVKKLFVFIAIIIAIALVIFFVMKLNGGSKPSKEETETVENLSIDYYANLTYGYATEYNGLDYLYSKDKVTYDDLDLKAILYSAIRYAQDKELDISVSNDVLNIIENSGSYGKLDSYSAYNGKGIRNAVKELFGKDLEDASDISSYGFLYDFFYISDYDIYLMKRNNVTSIADRTQSIDYTIIETTKNKDKISTTIAIAYRKKDGNNYSYAKDSKGENIIVESASEFPTDKIDEFEKYKITLSIVDKEHYVFDSIEKVK